MSLSFDKGYTYKEFEPYTRENLVTYQFSPSQTPKYINKSGISFRAISALYQELTSGVKKIPYSKAMQNGTEREDVSIEMYNKTFGTEYVKNEDRYENDILVGTPDIIAEDKIIDIKTSHTLESYNKYTEKAIQSKYMYQGLSYCILLEKDVFEIALTNIENERISLYTFNFLDKDKTWFMDTLKKIRKLIVSYYDSHSR